MTITTHSPSCTSTNGTWCMYPVMRRSIETTDLCLTGKFSNTLTCATWFFRHTVDTEIDGYRFFSNERHSPSVYNLLIITLQVSLLTMVMLDGVSNNSKTSRLYCSSKPGISSGLPIAASNTSFQIHLSVF
jgi:DNA-binding protein Fis